MSNTFGYIDIILLAMIAGFIILRLRNILGKRTGHEDKPFPSFSQEKFKKFKKESLKVDAPKSEILEGDDKVSFLKGAELAYENIIIAFSKGDEKNLKTLLTPEMSKNFEEAIAERKKNQIKTELTFVGIKESNLEKHEKVKSNFFASVKFVSEIISVKKDKNDNIIEGNPDKIKTVIDHWKFTKNIFSKNPNWHLAEIISK